MWLFAISYETARFPPRRTFGFVYGTTGRTKEQLMWLNALLKKSSLTSFGVK